MTIKRPVWDYLMLAFLTATLTIRSMESGHIAYVLLWALGAFIAGVELVFVLLYRNYMELRDGMLVLYEEFFFFRKKEIHLADIEKVIMEPRVFRRSAILLKNGSKVRFNDGLASFDRYRSLFRKMEVPVEG